MRKLIFVSFMSLSFVFAQTWKNTIDLSISAGSNERIDLYSDAAGNHLVVQTASQIIYYLYSYNGTLIRSSTLDTHSESKRLSSVTGSDGKVYVIYKKGSAVLSKRSTDGGASWTALTSIPMTYSTSDGLDAVSDNTSSYLTWSEKQGATDDYETYYMKVLHGNTQWQDKKQVTDQTDSEGGVPSITLAPNRVTIGFAKIYPDPVVGDFGIGYSRELYNSSWQSLTYIGNSIQSNIINDNSKSHAFALEPGDVNTGPGEHFRNYSLSHYTVSLGSSNWSYESTITGYGEYLPPENIRVNQAYTNNDFLHIVYSGTTYKKWDGSSFTDTYTFGNGDNNKITANGDDIYVVWIENGTIKMRQRDYAPLAPQNLVGTNENNHPKLTWDANGEADLRRYKVYRLNGDANEWYVTGTSYVDEDVTISQSGGDHNYVVKAVDWPGNFSNASNQVTFHGYLGKTIAGNFNENISESFKLYANYPNPFNPVTKISFNLSELSTVSLKVFDISGKEIATLAEGSKDVGFYTATFNGSDLSSGIYIYKFTAKGLESGMTYTDIKRMLLIK